jgi:hypothetical protein
MRAAYSSSVWIAELAVSQHADYLRKTFSNIMGISSVVWNRNEHSVVIYVKDLETRGMPDTLAVLLPDGSKTHVATEIVTDMGSALPQFGQRTMRISASMSPEYYGSMCCLVKSNEDPDFVGIVTSGHVMTQGIFSDFGGKIPDDRIDTALLNDNPDAEWCFQLMEYDQDLAIARLRNPQKLPEDYISFAQGYYDIQDTDVKTPEPNVTIVSRNNNSRDAFILDYNVSLEVDYDTPQMMRRLIFIGSVDSRNESQTISKEGDSGSCVFHKETGKLIGMLLGGNEKFSFVLPLKETLESHNFKLI